MKRAAWYLGPILLMGAYAWQAYQRGPWHWGSVSVLVLLVLTLVGSMLSQDGEP